MAATQVFRTGANALITGAASGVGLATAKLCAAKGMNLILVDNNSAKLQEASAAIRSKATIESHEVDVASLEQWRELKKSVEADGRKLDFLHLNAGIGLNGSWSDASYFQKIFNVNFFGVVNGINTFYDHFDKIGSDQKAIIITGSKQGITNPPGNPAYNASKSAIKTIAEHLHFDLAKTAPSTSVHLLVPGWTFTNMTAGAQTSQPAGAWSAEQVADYMYQKMSQDKFYIICPDNDVDWETDRKRMTWTMGDVVYERKPQSRWLDEFKEEAGETLQAMSLGSKQKGSSA